MTEAIIIDTETTGVDKPDVLELAWSAFEFNASAAVAGGHVFFMPEKEIELGALATHHILLEDLHGCIPSTRVGDHTPKASYWIGHNVDFDWRVLGEPRDVKRICTLAMARSIWPKLDSHKLTAMIYFTQGRTPAVRERVKQAHGAAADIELCRSLLLYITEAEGLKTLPDLWAFLEDCRIPKLMTFGKYKGQPVSAVDKGWANWYARQDDTDPYLITALKKARKL